MALYNKYRPYKLDMLYGQEYVRKVLTNQVKKNKMAHAYLFTGPAGTGKTSAARVLAAMVNATNGMTDSPSMDDPIVERIISGRNNMDVFEMDAASNRGIDDIKELRSRVYLSPMEMRKKIYIIDECHQLTTEAWNALLKILEEPPQHAIFVLCTTDPKKVLETIKTRCQCFEFKPILLEDIVKQLRQIAAAERIEIDDEAVVLVARAANGSLRNAISKLEALSDLGERITTVITSTALGITSRQTLIEFVNAAIDGDFLIGMKTSSEALSIGLPAEKFLSLVGEICHDLAVSGVKGYDISRTGYLPDEVKALTTVKDRFVEIAGAGNFRKLLFRWVEVLNDWAEISIFKYQPQDLVNFTFMVLFYEIKPYKDKAASK
jgi:DNA polymerase-3 subunit gamma/tau